jgi:hypothetical protein
MALSLAGSFICYSALRALCRPPSLRLRTSHRHAVISLWYNEQSNKTNY